MPQVSAFGGGASSPVIILFAIVFLFGWLALLSFSEFSQQASLRCYFVHSYLCMGLRAFLRQTIPSYVDEQVITKVWL